MFITGDEIAAHAGFHVDGKLHCFVGVTDHPVGVFHPLDHRQQVTDDHGKHDGAQQANPQRQGHVAAQKFAETALIDRRRLVHRQRPELRGLWMECAVACIRSTVFLVMPISHLCFFSTFLEGYGTICQCSVPRLR
ncbi:hypothetical protein D9M73_209940 [compost metagenome]